MDLNDLSRPLAKWTKSDHVRPILPCQCLILIQFGLSAKHDFRTVTLGVSPRGPTKSLNFLLQ